MAWLGAAAAVPSGKVMEKREPRPSSESISTGACSRFATRSTMARPSPTPFLAAARIVSELVEFLENGLPFVARDADSGIDHVETQEMAAMAAADQDFACLRIAYGVADEVAQHAFEQMAVGAQHGACAHHAQLYADGSRLRLELAMQGCEQRAELEIGNVGLQETGIELGDVHQRGEQMVHGGECRIDALYHVRGAAGGHFLSQRAQKQAGGVQRLVEVVAGGGQKAGLAEIGAFGGGLCLLQGGLHLSPFIDLMH